MKEKFLTFLISAVFFIFRFIPSRVVVCLGRFVGWFLYRIIRFKRKRIVDNLNIVFGSPEHWPKDILGRIYRHFGLLIFELMKLPSLNGDGFTSRFQYHGEENLKKALEKKQGVLLISAHTGNWEYGITSFALKGYKPHVVAKKIKNVDTDYVYEQIRGKKGSGSIMKDDKAALQVRRALKRNEIVLMVLDQNSKRSEGIFVDHFTKKASTFLAPYIFSSRFKCPVVFGFNYRDENLWDHHCYLSPEFVPIQTGDKEKDQLANTQAYVKAFEEFLMKHPEQWIWMHRRWRTQPVLEKAEI
jgi:KDO2-lipid IV(A) lauroyltransferase